MYKIGKENVEKIVVDKCQWGYEEYKPLTTLEISCDDEGFNVLFNISEKNPMREKKDHLLQVNEDSCVELFFEFFTKNIGQIYEF